MKNSGENVFEGIPVGEQEPTLVQRFLAVHDFAPGTRRGIVLDLRKLARWFADANAERFVVGRVTTRDVTDFKEHLRREKGQAVSTVNRTLVMVRRFFGWLVQEGIVPSNPAQPVKELKRVQLAPNGLHRTVVRRLLREIELRQDVRANALFHLLLYTGCRIGDVVALELGDLLMGERAGHVVFRFGKGHKQRSVPLPLPARRAMQGYLASRPPALNNKVFLGERGALGERGIRAMCDKYSALIGVHLHPHVFRHTFAKQFLADNNNDLVALAQLLGHENIQTTARYSRHSQEQLADASERLNY
jgi:integrase/recombinase XerC